MGEHASRSHARLPRQRRGGNRVRVPVYLTEAERFILEQKAENTGRSMSRLLVESALHAPSTDRLDPVEFQAGLGTLADYQNQLRGMATNLNQIAHHANTIHEVPADVTVAARQARALMDQIETVFESIRR